MSTPLMMSRLERYHQGARQKICELSYLDFAYAVSCSADSKTGKRIERTGGTPDSSATAAAADRFSPGIEDFLISEGIIMFIESREDSPENAVSSAQNSGISALHAVPGGIRHTAFGGFRGKTGYDNGTPVSMRPHRQLKEDLAGPFINTLPCV